MIPEFDITIPNRNGRDLFCTVTAPLSNTEAPLVILLHGFKGFRNWGFFPITAQEIARNGAVVIRMDFALNGMRGTNQTVVSAEDFAGNTISHEVNDLHDLIDVVVSSHELASVRDRWNKRLHLLGHSRGGAVVHVVAKESLVRTDLTVGPCVVWNTIGTGDRWTQRQRDHWRSVGYLEVENTRTGQILRLNSSFLDDLESNSERLSLTIAAKALEDRMLYIHAETDLTVNIDEIQNLLKTSGSSAHLEVVEGSTHTFGMTHPVEHITHSFAHVINLTVRHLLQ